VAPLRMYSLMDKACEETYKQAKVICTHKSVCKITFHND
jgi:hypothetical protein